jgi:hypothetical protein
MLAQLAFSALGVVMLCTHAARTPATVSLIKECVNGLAQNSASAFLC